MASEDQPPEARPGRRGPRRRGNAPEGEAQAPSGATGGIPATQAQ